MNATTMRKALQYAGGFGVAIFFVLLLSFIFSFLGTIFCAALAGMMLGATRKTGWLALPVSLIFPVVIFTLLRTSRAELSNAQINGVSVLCAGAFWLSYGVAFAVLRAEHKHRKRAGAQPAARQAPRQAGAVQGSAAVATVSAAGAGSPGPARRLSLDLLQGRWRWEPGSERAERREKVIEIERTRLVLSIRDSQGQAAFVATAELKLGGDPNRVELALSEAGAVHQS
jgi:hypothetical protein